jgi:hypothetical protein
MFKQLWIVVAIIATLGRSDVVEKGNLDELIDGVFNSKAGGEESSGDKKCNGGKGECVPYYLVISICLNFFFLMKFLTNNLLILSV